MTSYQRHSCAVCVCLPHVSQVRDSSGIGPVVSDCFFFFILLVRRFACMPAWPHFLIDILELFLHWTAMLRVIVKFAWTTNYSYCTRTFQPISFEIPTPNCFKNKSTFSLPQIEIHRKQIVTKSQFPIINFIRVAVFHRVSWRKKILPMTFCSLIRSNWATINDKRYNKTNSNSK